MNAQLLLELGRLWRTGGDASLALELDDVQRVVHVRGGAFVGAESNAEGDTLVDLLVRERRIDAGAAQGALRNDARRLVTNGWLGAVEAAAAMGRVALLRFEHALSMRATVQRRGLHPGNDVVDRPLGPLLVELFRTRLPPHAAALLVRDFIRTGHTLDLADLRAHVERLELMPVELKRARALALGGELATLAQSAESAPLVAALMSVTARAGDGA